MKKKYKKIKFYAFRDDKGATGGPGGVLYLQKNLIGENLNNTKCEYYFRDQSYPPFFKTVFKGAFVQTFLRELFSFGNYYVCNDIGTAFALSVLGRKYSLIYHQQGPVIQELINFNNKPGFIKNIVIHIFERFAFTRAQSVHFPSNGAKEMYFNNKYRSCKEKNVKIHKTLPNTIEIKKYKPLIVEEKDKLTFLSVGTLTPAKGQDQVLEFLDTFLQNYKKPCRLILVGQGPMEETIVQRGEALAEKYSNFEFIYRIRMPHYEVIRMCEISDVYIMLQRISIFDLATLEAMSNSCALILSNIGGNIDFNKNNNVVLVDTADYEAGVKSFLKSDINLLKRKNKEVFDNNFSAECFADNYKNILSEVIK